MFSRFSITHSRFKNSHRSVYKFKKSENPSGGHGNSQNTFVFFFKEINKLAICSTADPRCGSICIFFFSKKIIIIMVILKNLLLKKNGNFKKFIGV
jgi:hypothetical protein